MIFDTSTKTIQWENNSLFNKCAEQLNIHMYNDKVEPLSTSHDIQKLTQNESKNQNAGVKLHTS